MVKGAPIKALLVGGKHGIGGEGYTWIRMMMILDGNSQKKTNSTALMTCIFLLVLDVICAPVFFLHIFLFFSGEIHQLPSSSSTVLVCFV